MSHRLRTKSRRKGTQMGMNHHSDYSSSTTHFPRSYSIFGTPILIPTKILPLCSENTLNYISKQEQLLQKDNPILNLTAQDLSQIKQANLTIMGKIIKKDRHIINRILFFLSMACCCLLSLFSSGYLRRKLYTSYETSQQQYQVLGKIISQKLIKCQKLIINIQDNKFNRHKASILVNSLKILCEHDSQSTKLIVIRNYCYYMNEKGFQIELTRLYHKNQSRFIFIWENFIRDSKNYQNLDAQQQMLNDQDILQC